jgi:plasmid stabilization system protein ParE
MKPLRLGKDAAEELEEAAAWYESEQEGLGERFVQAVEHALQLLSENNPPLTPADGNAGSKGARKLVLHKFPFSLVVYELPTSIVVVALAHHSRKPGYWRSRRAQ